MPPVTRRASNELKRQSALRTRSTKSGWGENNLRIYISNYYKMSKTTREYHERVSFSKEQEITFAEYLLQMHTEGKISSSNISSYVVLEIIRHFKADSGAVFEFKSVRSKYYALRDITRLYISFKRRGTGMGWDTQNYTFIMDDPRWSDLQQVNKNFYKFHKRNCFLYHMLEPIFASQGATGNFSAGFENSPPNSDEELQMENAARAGRAKGVVENVSADDEVQVVKDKKGKKKMGLGKRKSGDMLADSLIRSPSSHSVERYNRIFDSFESLVNRKRGSRMTGSVTSPSKNAPPVVPAKSPYETALEQLSTLGLDWDIHEKFADILQNENQRAIWFTARNDADRIAFGRLRDCFPPGE